MIICSPIVYNIIILIAQLSAIAIIDNLITIILSYFKRIDINIWKNQSKITMITTINKISNYKNKTESIYIKALILFVIIITPFINILLSNLIIPQVIIQDVKNSNITMNIDVSKILCSGNFKNSTIENIKKCLKNNVCNNINNCTLNEKVDGINIIFSNDTYDHISLKPKNINNFSKIGDTNMTNIDILYNAGNFTYIDFYNPGIDTRGSFYKNATLNIINSFKFTVKSNISNINDFMGIRETTNINTLKQDWDDDDEKNPWYYNSELIPSTGSDAFLSSINFYNSYSAEKYINLINIFNKTHIVLSTSLTYLYHYEGLGKDKNYPINNITSIIDDADVTNIFNEILNKTYYNSAMLNNYIYMGEVIKYDNNTVIQYQLLSQNTGRDSYGMSIIYLTIRKHNYYLRKSPVIGKDYKLSNRLIDCNKIGICDNGLRSAMNRIAIYSNKLTVPYSSYGDVVKNNFILDLSSEGFLDNVKVEDLI